MATTTAQQALALGEYAKDLTTQLESVTDELDRLLWPAICAWKAIEPPGCGQMGGWSFDGLRDGRVHLEHDCWSAHGYDRPDVYATSVDLEELLRHAPTG